MLDVWEPEERVMKLYWYTPTELKAMDKLKILNLAIKLKKDLNDPITKDWLRVDNIDEEQEVYIQYFQTLPVWQIKNKAIRMRYDVIKHLDELKQNQPQETLQSWATNSARNVATAQATSAQMQWWTPGLADLQW
jgi:hypothetical protein